MLIRELLSEHITIVNRHGLDSKEEKEFLEHHKDNTELMELCETARRLKRILSPHSVKE